MNFDEIKYQHIERWDTDEVQYLKQCKTLTVMPKLDGTNGVVYFEDGEIKVGSRNRELSADNDNYDFYKYIMSEKENYLKFFKDYPNCILYGEYWVSNTFRSKPEYKNKFYVFDIFDIVNKEYKNMSTFKTILENYGIYAVPSKEVKTEIIGTPEFFNVLKEFGRFGVDDVFETGEGYVIKDFSNHKNQYGRTTWAKILNEKPNIHGKTLWEKIRENFFTDAWIEKESIKYFDNNPDKFIPEKYFNILVNEFIKEEIANIVIKYKYPKINFQELKISLRNVLTDYLKEKGI